MTDTIQTEKTETMIPQLPVQPKRKGRPPKQHLEAQPVEAKSVVEANLKPIKKAQIISESVARDIWRVDNKDPNLHYVWGRKDNDIEMSIFASKGYVPARGNERIFGNPFETAPQGGVGKTKVRGNRILMCCNKEAKEARVRERLARRIDAKTAAQIDARKMAAKGVTIIPQGSSETKRESLGE